MTKKETKTLAGVIGNPPRPSQALKDLREIISELPRLGGDAVKYFPKLKPSAPGQTLKDRPAIIKKLPKLGEELKGFEKMCRTHG